MPGDPTRPLSDSDGRMYWVGHGVAHLLPPAPGTLRAEDWGELRTWSTTSATATSSTISD
ncbi:MAG: hypothetical protein WBA12_13475 [Catalinimonas sp.]